MTEREFINQLFNLITANGYGSCCIEESIYNYKNMLFIITQMVENAKLGAMIQNAKVTVNVDMKEKKK